MANIATVFNYESFAKINLFLHILNKRDDGYHNLQTWFTFVDLKDYLEFSFNDSNKINIFSNKDISPKEDNLIFKAIRIFQKNYNIHQVGVDVKITKNIPLGAGLGGGSSNAAVTLMAMRDFYIPSMINKEMLQMASQLGADVAIFLYGQSAWAEGIGDILKPKAFKPKYILLIKPNVHISTAEFFNREYLSKRTNLLSDKLDFDSNIMGNDFEKIFFAKYPDFKDYFESLNSEFRMTGTGSCFYLLSDDKAKLERLTAKIDKSLDKWMVKTLNYAN